MSETPFQVLQRPLDADEPSYWREDPLFQSLLGSLLSGPALDWLRPQLERMGALAPEVVDPLARVADRQGPVHKPVDAFGNRVDHIEHHPAYRDMERVAYGSGMVSLKYDPEVRKSFPASSHVMGFALGYLFAQAESGLYCPVCMTDGVARVLELHGSPEQRERVVPRLSTRDPDRLWRGAMFLTEKQAGSDVGALATRAVRQGGAWRLFGEKWFCSNVDAEAILTLARPEGAPEGTRGLGLFLVLRDGEGGRRNGIRIERIKEKLGVRSMATGEVTLEGAVAEQVGPLDAGFKGMAEMLNLSRLYNAVASVAIARRACYEARRYLRARDSFGGPAIRHPLVRETLADLHAEVAGAVHLVFRVAESLDRADAGSALDGRRARALIPLVKLTTARLAVRAASEGIELLGGNGYIEDFVMPRLLRDAQVLPVWEGTTNILRLDVLRTCRKEGAHRLLVADTLARCEASTASFAAEAGAIAGLAREVEKEMDRVIELSGQRQAGLLRRAVDRLALAYTLGLLLKAATEPSQAAFALRCAARRLAGALLDPGMESSEEEIDALIG